MSLSDKRELKKYGLSYVYPEKHVKEAVRRLKDLFKGDERKEWFDANCDEIFGDKLTG